MHDDPLVGAALSMRVATFSGICSMVSTTRMDAGGDDKEHHPVVGPSS